MMEADGTDVGRRQRIIEGFEGYAAGQSELGRVFARHMGLHVTDAAATVEILRAEQRGQPLTPAQLATRLGLTRGSTSVLLNRLEDAGHITRIRGHADRRKVTLESSAMVHTTADAFFAPLRARIDAAIGGYTSDELDVVHTFVVALREIVEDYAAGSVTGNALAASSTAATQG